jgi:hypothetical protein
LNRNLVHVSQQLKALPYNLGDALFAAATPAPLREHCVVCVQCLVQRCHLLMQGALQELALHLFLTNWARQEQATLHPAQALALESL